MPRSSVCSRRPLLLHRHFHGPAAELALPIPPCTGRADRISLTSSLLRERPKGLASRTRSSTAASGHRCDHRRSTRQHLGNGAGGWFNDARSSSDSRILDVLLASPRVLLPLERQNSRAGPRGTILRPCFAEPAIP